MLEYKSIAIAMDLSEMDRVLLAAVRHTIELQPDTELHLMHVLPDEDDFEIISEFFSDEISLENMFKAHKDTIAEEMVNLVRNSLDHVSNLQIKTHIVNGKKNKALFDTITELQPSLIVAGRKHKVRGSGKIINTVLRNLPSEILMVPENMDRKRKLRKMMVPVDLSEASVKLLKKAEQLKKSYFDLQVIALKVVEIPPLDLPTIHTHDHFINSVIENQKEAYHKFKAKHQISDAIPVKFEVNSTQALASCIYDSAVKEDCDLIMMGARGHSRMERFMLGSVTEHILQVTSNLPVLVAHI